MCGIAGWAGRATPPPVLEAMLAALEHRGPDDTGRFVRDDVALGMTRLSIIDLVTGQQPMTTEDGAATLVFNGEIYNFRAVRQELEAAGHRFRTQSDTEVILRAWQADGEACVQRFRGMFAFALWDAPRRRLFLARDRVGKKPLYYAIVNGALVFASEIKALLRYPGVPRAVDREALHHYLAFGYTPGARSIFAGIFKLPPGHTAMWIGGRLDVRRYWTLPEGGAERVEDDATLRARISDTIHDAVRLRLEADVPLGVFLSGGIDSSVIVAAMRRVTSGRIATFSIGFGSDVASFDELPYARAVARRFETDHHEERVSPAIAKIVPAIVRQFDEPFADSSAIPTFLVSAATAQHVKVALSGIGGDETFGGYPRYLGVRASEWYARAPRAAQAVGRGAVALMGDSDRSRNLADWARRFAAGPERPMPERYLGWTRFFDGAGLAAVGTPALAAWLTGDVESAARAAWAGRRAGDAVDGAFRIDLATYLPDDLLTMADRMSMAHSLELRAPFCDHVLIEEALRIPPSVKLARFGLKSYLKSLFADTLPSEVLRHRKQGFMIPLARWLRGELRPLMEDLLAPDTVRARGLFAADRVEALKAEHLGGRRGHADRLWTLMMLEAWLREYLDGVAPWSLDGDGAARVAAAASRARRASQTAALPPLSVLMVSDVAPLKSEGGGERVLWEHARGLARRGHRITVLGRAIDGAPAGETERDGVRVVTFPAPRGSTLSFARAAVFTARRAAAVLLAREAFDAVDVFQPLGGYGVLGLPAARRLPTLYTFLSPAPLEYRSRARMTRQHLGGVAGRLGAAALWSIERACLLSARRIQVLSDYSAQQLWQLYRITADRVVKIPGAADLRRFRPAADRDAVRAELGLPKEAPVLLTVRNLEVRMGLDTLLHAMAGVVARRPDARLLIGGAGSLRADLERLTDALGLRRHVQFLGFIADDALPLYYQAADCFVLPTRELEGFGLVTIEALACGTPVLGTPVGATPELLDPIDPALVFPAATAPAMTETLLAFLGRAERDPAAARRLREVVRAHVERTYDWDAIAGSVERELRGLVAGDRGAEPPGACEACGAALGSGGLAYRGQPYRRCRRCGAGAVVAMPTAEELRRTYESTYPRRFAPSRIRPPRRQMLATILRELGRRAGRGRLLDVGCGGGHLLQAARGAGWRGVGVDLSHVACASARGAAGVPVVQADAAALPFRDGTLDVVTLVNVLDHTAAALTALREAARVLRPGGVLALRVPNGAVHTRATRALARLGPLARLAELDAFPVLHVFFFGERALRRLLARAGFDVLRVANSDLAWEGAGTASRALQGIVRGAAGAAAAVSRGHWLVGPSLEVYARRR